MLKHENFLNNLTSSLVRGKYFRHPTRSFNMAKDSDGNEHKIDAIEDIKSRVKDDDVVEEV